MRGHACLGVAGRAFGVTGQTLHRGPRLHLMAKHTVGAKARMRVLAGESVHVARVRELDGVGSHLELGVGSDVELAARLAVALRADRLLFRGTNSAFPESGRMAPHTLIVPRQLPPT